VTVAPGALPRNELPELTRLYRIHRAENGTWFFDTSPDGRFNPTATAGRGACYWSTTPLGAFVESYRTPTTIAREDIDARRIATISLLAPLTVADLTQRSALSAGVTAALTSGGDYQPAQTLADTLQGQTDGILYHASHDLAGQLTSVALFGPAGAPDEQTIASLGLPEPEVAELDPQLLADAEEAFGYRIIPMPQ